MGNSILSNLGIDPIFIFIIMLVLIIVLFVMVFSLNMKCERMRSNYNMFMRGKDGKTLEKSLRDQFGKVDAIAAMARQNRQEIRKMIRSNRKSYQKVGIVKYDAFNEMGGRLSFALAMLDDNDSGWIINAMHSREGCYTYIKEIVKGESYIELSEEEADALEKAILQEAYGLDIDETSNLAAALTGKMDLDLHSINQDKEQGDKVRTTTRAKGAPTRKPPVRPVKGTKKIRKIREIK